MDISRIELWLKGLLAAAISGAAGGVRAEAGATKAALLSEDGQWLRRQPRSLSVPHTTHKRLLR